MTAYSASERASAMRRVGFPESSIPLGTAISLAELGERSDTATVFGDNGESVGVWQIHLPAHPDVPSACAMDLECSTRAAYRISSGGTNWKPWGAFTNGSYQKFLAYASSIVPSKPEPAPSTAAIPVAANAPTEGDVSAPSPLTGFRFPTFQLGPFSFLGEALFKVAITLGALALVFVGIIRLTGIEPGPLGAIERKVPH